MARPEKAISYSLIKVKTQKLTDPYVSGRLVPVGGHMIVDEKQADFFETCNMCDIVKEEVLPPWDKNFNQEIYDDPEAQPIKKEPVNVKETKASAQA